MFDTDGTFIRDYPIVNNTFRTGYLGKGKHIFQFTQGKFRQPCSEANHGIDPDVSSNTPDAVKHSGLAIDLSDGLNRVPTVHILDPRDIPWFAPFKQKLTLVFLSVK